MAYLSPKQAFEILNKKNWTNKEYEEYVKKIDALGREDRIAEGNFYYGKEEEKKAIAIESLKEGLSLEIIAKITGLSIAQVQDIQNKL